MKKIDSALLARATAHSRFLQRLLEHPPAAFEPASLAAPLSRERIRALLSRPSRGDERALQRALRETRRAVMIQVIARDLAGHADLDEVMRSMTLLAEESIQAALGWHTRMLEAEHGQAIGAESGRAQPLLVVGMGKLGGEELNVSSDVDLVLLYGEEGESMGPRVLSNQEYFERLGRKLVSALSEYTEDGQVFRVDLRLRPYGESGPLAMSLPMLENYLHAQGRDWERYAWVKAREVTGRDDAALMALVTPFVYRRHLDYSALSSLRDLHAQIRVEVARRELHENIKLGPGGIREIEFITQVFQLIRGGRDRGLRLRPTRTALARLGERRLLPATAVADLQDAYAFLRNLEHRLQYLEDQQTHTLPSDERDQRIIAASMDYPDAGAFRSALERHRTAVRRQFDAVFAGDTAAAGQSALSVLWRGGLSDEEALAHLRALDFAQPGEVWRRLRELHDGPRYRRMSAATQARVDRLMPRLLEAAARFENPDQTFERLARVVESIGRREPYLALLLEYPAALERLASWSAASPWAAEYLARHPMLLDELIAPQAYEPPEWPALEAGLAEELRDAEANVERQMDLLRHFKHAQTLRLLAQDLAGVLPLETLSDHLSDLASVILRQVVPLAWAGVRTRHRADPRFAVIGYGKLGGKELGYASDLDLIFLYDDALEAQEHYTRLAQRINTWLTSLTAAGVLYETDLRLRPDGASGLLVSRLDAFTEYQRTKAWVFEHQALTRARFVAGDAHIGREFERLRHEILCLPRAADRLRTDIVAMRQRMLEGHPNRSGRFDLKHDRGGIVDVEFAVQYLVLGFARQYPELTGNIGNLALLLAAGRLGLIGAATAAAAHHSYREFRRLQHALRLQGEPYARVPRERVEGLIEPVLRLWEEVFGTKGTGT